MSEENQSVKKIIDFKDQQEALAAFGEYDKNLRELERIVNVKIQSRGCTATIYGNAQEVDKAVNELTKYKNKLYGNMEKALYYKTPTGRSVKPIGRIQKEYIKAIREKDLVVAIGPAGTGKTFIACMEAVRALNCGEIERIILTRPVVEAGEKLGFLPGDLHEKVNPYLRPLYDAFYTLIGPEKFQKYKKDEIIEVVPLAYMRGRTLDDAIIILDEAQNTLSGQMQMFLTRIGFNSKAIITGDITQIDLDKKQRSGLIEIQKILSDIREIGFIYFSNEDVIRHKLVKRIIDAYNRFKKTD